MASLTGQPFPEDVTFHHIPYIADKSGLNEVCGMPVAYKASEGMCPLSRNWLSPYFLSQKPIRVHKNK